MALRVVLDTDPGIDDSLAILLALASPEIDLAGVCVTGGNCSLEAGVRNALNVLAVAGRADMPVHAGVGLPIIREIMSRPGDVTLVAVAPLTNVALAIRKEPRIVQNVREVIIMGGALRADGNTTSLAEFNFYVDPHAAHIVLESGMPITLLPWDITKDVLLTQADVDRMLAVPSPITRFIADATRFYIEFHEVCFGFSGCSINDPIALALAFMPDLARTQAMHVAVEYTSELTAGKSVISYVGDSLREPDAHDQLGFDAAAWPMQWGRQVRSRANVRAVVEFDSARFIALFVERMERLAGG